MPQAGDDLPREHPRAPHSSTPSELSALLAADREGLPFLHLRDAEGRQHLHQLPQGGGAVRLGRSAPNDVCLAWDDTVSSVHAELVCVSDEWVVIDDGLSSFGTFLNGERVQGRRRLRNGDRLRLGQTIIVFHTAEADEPVPTAAQAVSPARGALTPAQHLVLVALCRPLIDGSSSAPASTRAIAAELVVSRDAVKKQLGSLYRLFGLQNLVQNQKRADLAKLALHEGLVSKRHYG